VFQDSRGFIWIGTQSGLCYYDGIRFTAFTTADGLGGNNIADIVEDHQGNLWVGTSGGGVCRIPLYIQNGRTIKTFTIADGLMSNDVNALFVDKSGKVWCATADGVSTYTDGKFTAFAPDNLFLGEKEGTYAILEDANGDMWFATAIGVLLRYSKGVITGYLHHKLSWSPISGLLQDKRGNLWVTTFHRGVYTLKPEALIHDGEKAIYHHDVTNVLPHNIVSSLFEDNRGNIWLGTDAGLCKLVRGSFQLFTTANGLANEQISDIMQDREGNLWFATYNGVSKLPSEKFLNYTVANGFRDSAIKSLLQDSEGSIWCCTNAGVTKLSHGLVTNYTHVQGLGNEYVHVVFRDRSGALWFGTYSGISKLPSPRSKRFWNYSKPDADGSTVVRAGFQDRQGALWFGMSRYVRRFAKGVWMDYRVSDEPADEVVAIQEDRTGSIVVATAHFVVRKFEAGRFVACPPSQAIAGILIGTMYIDKNGDYWFGTSNNNGVIHYIPSADGKEEGTFIRYDVAECAEDNVVRSIIQDSEGKFWFATTGGVVRFNPHAEPARHIQRRLTFNDGLASNHVYACLQDKDGSLWFGTANGLSHYNPKEDTPDTCRPPVYITRISIAGEDFPLTPFGTKMHVAGMTPDRTLDLGYTQNSVAFEWAGLSFRDESGVQYQYMLEGSDKDWSPVTESHYINYAQLPAGNYRFKVIARNVDGVWSEQPATVSFVINPPFWQRWWFITLTLVAIGAVVHTVYRYRINRIIEMERMRTKIAMDLHDDIGSTLGSIALYSELAKTQVGHATPLALEFLNKIGELSREAVDAMGEIVWSIDPRHDNLQHVIIHIRDYATKLCQAKGLRYRFAIPKEVHKIEIPVDIRRNLYLIAKEGLNNIIKHSGATSVDMQMSVNNNSLELRISDNGKGFDVKSAKSGHGLLNMQKRAAMLKGTLTFQSEIGKGTTVLLNVKIA